MIAANRSAATTSDIESLGVELAIVHSQNAALREELRAARGEVRSARKEAQRAWETLRLLAAVTDSEHMVEEILRDVDLT